jgi:ribonuclease Z
MQLTFLGTSSGAPTKDRNVTGLAVRAGGEWDLYDCGEATQHRLLDTPLSLHKLRNVFISHLHGDHVFGLFGLLASRSMGDPTRPVTVYGPVGIEAMVRAVLKTSESGITYPLDFHELGDDGGLVLDDERRTVEALPLNHRVTSFAWWVQERPRPGTFDVDRARELGVPDGPLFGQLKAGEAVELDGGTTVKPGDVVGAERSGRSFVISGDNNDPASLLARTPGAQLLVHEATFTEPILANLDWDYGHSTAARVAKAAAVAEVPNLILTHFSPRFGRDPSGPTTIDDVRNEAASHYKGNLQLADDYAEFEFTSEGELTMATVADV